MTPAEDAALRAELAAGWPRWCERQHAVAAAAEELIDALARALDIEEKR